MWVLCKHKLVLHWAERLPSSALLLYLLAEEMVYNYVKLSQLWSSLSLSPPLLWLEIIKMFQNVTVSCSTWSELENKLDQTRPPHHQNDIDNFQTSFIWRQKVSVGRRKRWCCLYKKVILGFLWWNMFDQEIILSENYF